MYDPKFSQKQMYDQYGRSRKTDTSKQNPGKQFAESMKAGGGGRNMSGIGAKPPSFGGGQDNNPNRDEAENKSTIKKVFERAVDLFKSFGADEPKDVIVDGKRVYQGPAFRGFTPTIPTENFGGEFGKQQYLFGAESLGIFGPGIKTTRSPVPPTLPPGTVNRLGVNTDNPRLNMFGVNRGFTKPPASPELPTITPQPQIPEAINVPIEEDYIIEVGDTLSEIAEKRGTTVDVLLEMNDIADKDKIYAGDKLKVPTKKLTDTQAALRRGLGSKKDMSGIQVAGLDPKYYLNEQGEITSDGFYDPESEYIESFRQGITPPKLMRTTGDDTYVSADYMSELEILARTIEAEAGGESKRGKLAVGAVIANRADSTKYGMDIRGVILRKAQFSPWNAITGYQKGISQAKPMLTEKMKPSKDSYDAAKKILSGDYEDPTGGAVHYLNPKIGKKPDWYGSFKKRGVKKIGRHEFGNADNNKKYDGKDYINTRVLKSPRPQSRPPGMMARRGLM